jgi:hypothetical protein
MIKKILLGIAFVAIVSALIMGAVQRTSAAAGESVAAGGRWGGGNGASQGAQSTGSVQSAGGTQANGGQAGATGETVIQHVDTTALIPGSLSEEETAGLLWMREEEKLARDVYQALYAQWGQATFQNIANSEQTHMDAVLNLLQGYGVADPALTQGQFTNPDLQALYDQLVAQGSQSLADALKVGAAIEEIDILDLRERAALTDEAAIQTVYASLESGSENHLRAYTSTLARRTGEIYQPQYLSAVDYQAIVGAANGQPAGGNQGSGANGAGGNGRRGGR